MLEGQVSVEEHFDGVRSSQTIGVIGHLLESHLVQDLLPLVSRKRSGAENVSEEIFDLKLERVRLGAFYALLVDFEDVVEPLLA